MAHQFSILGTHLVGLDGNTAHHTSQTKRTGGFYCRSGGVLVAIVSGWRRVVALFCGIFIVVHRETIRALVICNSSRSVVHFLQFGVFAMKALFSNIPVDDLPR